MLIVDREMVSVGSTNFEIRSFRLNDEASLNIYGRAFAERMSLVFGKDHVASSPYGLKKSCRERGSRMTGPLTTMLNLRMCRLLSLARSLMHSHQR